jgi:hypothetical protein
VLLSAGYTHVPSCRLAACSGGNKRLSCLMQRGTLLCMLMDASVASLGCQVVWGLLYGMPSWSVVMSWMQDAWRNPQIAYTATSWVTGAGCKCFRSIKGLTIKACTQKGGSALLFVFCTEQRHLCSQHIGFATSHSYCVLLRAVSASGLLLASSQRHTAAICRVGFAQPNEVQ